MDSGESLTNGAAEISPKEPAVNKGPDKVTGKRKASSDLTPDVKSKVQKNEKIVKKSTRIKKKSAKLLNSPEVVSNTNGAAKPIQLAAKLEESNPPEKNNKWSMISKAGRSVEFSSCVHCGMSGLARDFFEKGQYCSEQCIKLRKNSVGITGPSLMGLTKSQDSLKLLSGIKLATPPSVPTSIPVGASAPAMLCIPNCPPTTEDNKQTIVSTSALHPQISLINFTIANGEVLPGLSQVNKAEPNSNTAMPASFPLLLPVGNNQSLFMPSPGIGKNMGQSMMLLKPVTSGPISSNMIQPSAALQKGPLVTPINSIGDNMDNSATANSNMLQKTVLLPVIQSAATTQQTLSTPSGQQIQITLAPQNMKKSIAPTFPASHSFSNSITPTITLAPVVSQLNSDVSCVKSVGTKVASKAASSYTNTPKVVQVNSKVPANLVDAGQAAITSSKNLNNQILVKSDSAEKKNSGSGLAGGLEWDGDIGRLPGTNIKFKYNEFGSLEQVTDEVPGPPNSETEDKIATLPNTNESEPNKVCCENCGSCGAVSEFCVSEGKRFCSMFCAGAYKSNRQMKKSKETLKNKKLLPLKPLSTSNNETKTYDIKPYAKKTKPFNWEEYLRYTSCESASPSHFRNPYPSSKNGFKVGMKLEGIDPNHQSMFCVLSVADVLGYRVLLHFDGYSDNFDFWANADSTEIFPVGWCDRTGHTLFPPKDHAKGVPFNWQVYLNSENAQSAPRTLFPHVSKDNAQITAKGFRRGVFLEAVDKKNCNLVCVASVSDTMDNRFLLHFDGWDDSYDYWVDPTSPYIHPVGWCEKNDLALTPPKNYECDNEFEWEEYLKQQKANPAPARAFRPRQPIELKVTQKLEAVDPRNPALIRVASIKEKNAHSFKIHFDGWNDLYDFWVDDDSPDIHPINWCIKTGHPLQQPPLPPGPTDNVTGCKTHGCTGVGHFKGLKHTSHHSTYGCPYAPTNLNKDSGLQDRLGVYKEEVIISTLPHKKTSIVNGVNDISDVLKDDSMFKKCPTIGCDGTGHITGKFESHHAVSGCPLIKRDIEAPAEQTPPAVIKKKRGRKKKNFKDYVTEEYFSADISSERFSLSSPSVTSYKANKEIAANKTISESKKPSAAPVPEDKLLKLMNDVHQSVFYSCPTPVDPDQEFKSRWDRHVKLLPAVENVNSKIKEWSHKQVYEFLKSLSVNENIAKRFLAEEIDGESLLMLTQSDLIKIMDVKVGPAVIIYNSILKLKAHSDNHDDT